MLRPILFKLLLIVFFTVFNQFNFIYVPQPISQTRGKVWPKPYMVQEEEVILEVTGNVVWRIVSLGYSNQDGISCDVIDSCIERHKKYVELEAVGKYHKPIYPTIDHISIRVQHGCTQDYPREDMDESYTVTVNSPEILISSPQVWGALRGIETVSQLIYPDDNHVRLLVKKTSIVDKPKYSYRGFMIDTSRHYIPMQIILKQLDAMETVKLNVLHWHLTDDHSFPFVSGVFPDLTKFGAYNHHTHIYTSRDINEIIQEARLRGIRVIPELDIPAHTRSWTKGYPDLFNQCSMKMMNSPHGSLLDVENANTVKFLELLIGELVGIFQDHYFFLGGDEFDKHCVPGGTESFQTFFEELRKVMERLPGPRRRCMFWQDTLQMGASVPQNSIINVWKSWQNDSPHILSAIASRNVSVIVAHPWYLDQMKYGEKWRLNYDVEMFKQIEDPKIRSRVMGGNACLWTEFVDATNFLQWAWPDAGGTAENLWSHKVTKSTEGHTQERLNELRCRLILRGIPARPIQASSCHVEWSY